MLKKYNQDSKNELFTSVRLSGLNIVSVYSVSLIYLVAKDTHQYFSKENVLTLVQ